MTKVTITSATFGVLAATALALAGAAAAAPSGDSSASDTVRSLQAQGYNVQVNGQVIGPLSQCLVTGVHGEPAAPTPSTQFTTVYVDVSCPSNN